MFPLNNLAREELRYAIEIHMHRKHFIHINITRNAVAIDITYIVLYN